MWADQLQIKANELQAGHQREEECEVVMTADQRISSGQENQFYASDYLLRTNSNIEICSPA